jgi:hypothetical protein
MWQAVAVLYEVSRHALLLHQARLQGNGGNAVGRLLGLR